MLSDNYEIGQIVKVPVNTKMLPAVITGFTRPNNDIANRQLMTVISSKTSKALNTTIYIKQVLSGCSILERTLIVEFTNNSQLVKWRKDNNL